MKQSGKVALGGIVSALSLSLLVSIAVIPFLTYALPAVAGSFLCIIVVEIGKRWACAVYAAVAILSLLIVPEKEVAFLYCALFGYYPVAKAALEQRLPKWLAMLCKLLLFNAAIAASYFLMMRFMGVVVDEFELWGKWAAPILLGLGSLVFALYDYTLTLLIALYRKKWRKSFRKLFR